MIDKALCNVIILSLGFFCCHTAYITIFNAQKYILEAIKEEDPTYNGDAYISLCISYASVSLFNWLAPIVISVIGSRRTLFLAAILNIIYIAQFLYPLVWLLYFSSVISGIAGALSWTAQGHYLTLNSTKETISRNSGILWAVLQSGCMFGNIYILLTIKRNTVDNTDRKWLFGFMTTMVSLAAVIMLMLQKAVYRSKSKINPKDSLIQAGKLFITRDMLLLLVTFYYSGIELSFSSGVYSSAIGFSKNFDGNDTTRISISGLLIGLGEVVGGTLFSIFGKRTIYWGRYPIVILGFIIHILTFTAILVNFPDSIANGPTNEKAIIESNVILAYVCSFSLGFADSCFVTQIYGLLGTVFAKNSASAFGIYKFTQTLASAVAFFYTSIGLHKVMSILIVFAVLGTICFCIVELKPTYQQPIEELNIEQKNKTEVSKE